MFCNTCKQIKRQVSIDSELNWNTRYNARDGKNKLIDKLFANDSANEKRFSINRKVIPQEKIFFFFILKLDIQESIYSCLLI